MSLEVDIEHRQGTFRLAASFRAQGRLTALFGRSGSGKTTLVNVIAGLVRPQRARIAVDGDVLVDTLARRAVPRHRRRIGYVFQEGRLFPHLSVRQNLLFGRWFAGGRGGQDAGRGTEFDRVVELLGVEALLARRPGGLSGGEKQRVAIGRALLSRPRLLLMDEPLASLDEARKGEILPYLERLRDEAGVPIVYVSHSVAEVARLATTVVALEDGRVTATGPTAAIMASLAGSSPLRDDPAGGAVLEGSVAAHDARLHLTRLATPAGDLLVPRLERAVGAGIRVLVAARDVTLSLARPEGISALNILPGAVAALGPAEGAWVPVRIRCGEAALLARVTRKSVEDLDLAPGRPVFALIKGVSFEGSAVGSSEPQGSAGAP